jgi:hypothetical protein
LTNKIDKLLMVSDFNENWYLGVFWSEELVGNDEICIQGHFYEATIATKSSNCQWSPISLLNIYAKSCGNPFGSFRYKWGQWFWHMLTVFMATAAILKIPRPDGTSWDGDPPSCEV